jgi:hypothetical protein
MRLAGDVPSILTRVVSYRGAGSGMAAKRGPTCNALDRRNMTITEIAKDFTELLGRAITNAAEVQR